jgi:hypothetical protein
MGALYQNCLAKYLQFGWDGEDYPQSDSRGGLFGGSISLSSALETITPLKTGDAFMMAAIKIVVTASCQKSVEFKSFCGF